MQPLHHGRSGGKLDDNSIAGRKQEESLGGGVSMVFAGVRPGSVDACPVIVEVSDPDSVCSRDGRLGEKPSSGSVWTELSCGLYVHWL
jgi:hypothetical protein